MSSFPPCPTCGFVPVVPKPEGNPSTDANGNPVVYIGVIVCDCYPKASDAATR